MGWKAYIGQSKDVHDRGEDEDVVGLVFTKPEDVDEELAAEAITVVQVRELAFLRN